MDAKCSLINGKVYQTIDIIKLSEKLERNKKILAMGKRKLQGAG